MPRRTHPEARRRTHRAPGRIAGRPYAATLRCVCTRCGRPIHPGVLMRIVEPTPGIHLNQHHPTCP